MRTAPVRQSPIGPNWSAPGRVPAEDFDPPILRPVAHWPRGTGGPGGAGEPCWAQETKAPASDASAGSSLGKLGAMPLARYFPKDNLIFYFEFSGARRSCRRLEKTAAYKMLTETPLGEMLEEVGTQLLDKGLSYSPGTRARRHARSSL